MFELTMFPASDGDCLLLTWGETGALHHMVIDGGRASAWPHLRSRLEEIAEAGEEIDRLVLTHIDADHIEGLLKLTSDGALPAAPKQVWFNGLEQMTRLSPQGEKQGDAFSDELARLGWPLNTDFTNGTASMESAPADFVVAGLRITMLSPDRQHLAAMATRWAEWRDGHGPKMASFGSREMPATLDIDALAAKGVEDREPPNGSSIAFIAEYDGKRVFLSGDAHPDALAAALQPLARAEGGRYRIDLFKVSHHGSRKNTSPALARLLDCRQFAVSTNGSHHEHPDPEAIARLLKFAPEGHRRIYFNYRTPRTAPWDDEGLMTQHDYDCRWPDTELPGLLKIDAMEPIG